MRAVCLILGLAAFLGAAPLPLPETGVVLCYHRFGSESAKDSYQITLQRFREQLQALKAEGKPFTVSIDDGYASGMAAAEALESEGLRGIYFVYPGSTGKRRYLSAEQLRELERRGHRVASHSLTHPNLSRPDKGESAQAYQARLRHELRASKAKLERILGHAVTELAYPYGAYNDFVAVEAKAAGYERAYSVTAGELAPGQDPLRLPRRLLMGQPGSAAFLRFAHAALLPGQAQGLHEGQLCWQGELPAQVSWPGAERAYVGQLKLASHAAGFSLPADLKPGLYLLSFEAGQGATLKRSQLLFQVAPNIWRKHFTRHEGN